MTEKEKLSILWGYTRNNKADHSFYEELLAALDTNALNVRGKMLLLNAALNVGLPNRDVLWNAVIPAVTPELEQTIDHYVVRFGLLASSD
jgi:hypothetical protein